MRADVRAIVALVALDEGIGRRESAVARTLALVERATADLARVEPECATIRAELARAEQASASAAELDRLRLALRRKERHASQLMRLAERKQAEALSLSAELREACAELARRRSAFTDRLPSEALAAYERALQLGRVPAAVATRGTVCWGCFQRLPLPVTAEFRARQRFAACPSCDRLLFDPQWTKTA